MKEKIVATLICKNEEKILHRWLENVSKYVDEIIAVDDGSTDNSVNILKAHPKVSCVEILNNSTEGEKRNLALDKAVERGATWIIWLDADEILEDNANLNKLKHCDVNVVMMRLMTFWKGETHYRIDKNWGNTIKFGMPKMFRPKENTRWGKGGKLHSGFPSLSGKVLYSQIRIKHLGYIDEVVIKQKYELNKKEAPEKEYEHLLEDGEVIEWEEDEKIDIVILTNSNLDGLKKCIKSIKDFTPNGNIIVVDNNSIKEIKDYLKEERDITVWVNDENIPFTEAYNKVFKRMYRNFVICNDDVEVTSEWLTAIKKASLENGIVGILSDSPTQPWQNKSEGWNQKTISFFCAFIRYDVISRIGYLDENLIWWGSDDDYSYRAINAGINITVVNHIVHHKHSTSTSTLKNKEEIRKKDVEYLHNKWRRKKVQISVLNQGWMRVELSNFITTITHDNRYEITVRYPNDKPIANNRNKIVKDFLETDRDYLIMIDSDIVPQNNILDLIKLDKDIVACPCPQWHDNDIYWIVMDRIEDRYKQIPIKKREGLVEIDAVGTGCIIIARRVLEKVKAPFMRKWSEDGLQELGLDFYFCEKAKEIGYKVWAHFNYPCEQTNEIGMIKILNLVMKNR